MIACPPFSLPLSWVVKLSPPPLPLSLSLFKGLVTGTNGFGEIRVQFHTITDSHDQYEGPLEDLKETLLMMGQPSTRLFGTDNPNGDKAFFQNALPSLLVSERAFNAATTTTPTDAAATTTTGAPPDEVLPIDMATVRLHSGQDAINTACLGFRDIALAVSPNPVVGLDAEWDTVRNGRGDIIRKKGRVALIILSVQVSSGQCKTILLRTHNKPTLPK